MRKQLHFLNRRSVTTHCKCPVQWGACRPGSSYFPLVSLRPITQRGGINPGLPLVLYHISGMSTTIRFRGESRGTFFYALFYNGLFYSTAFLCVTSFFLPWREAFLVLRFVVWECSWRGVSRRDGCVVCGCVCGLGPFLKYRICFYELMEKALCLCVCVSYVYSERTWLLYCMEGAASAEGKPCHQSSNLSR